MLTCICCGPLPIENGIPGYLNFQEQKANQQTVSKGAPTQEMRAKRVKQSIEKNAGRLFLSGVLARANAVTSNRRVYSRETLVREGERYLKDLTDVGHAFGELEHPTYATGAFKYLHLATLSHQVIKMWWHEDELHGLIEVLDTPAGRLVRSLYCNGIVLGASTRGISGMMPPCQDQQYRVVANDFALITFDLLMMPASNSYLFAVREHVHLLDAPNSLQARFVKAANKNGQDLIRLHPTLNTRAPTDAATLQAEMALTAAPSQQREALAAEQAQAVEDAPRRSIGASLSIAVKDVKEHLHLGNVAGTGKERLLSKHRSSSSEMMSEDGRPATIKAKHGRQSSMECPSHINNPFEDTKTRLRKAQKLLDVLQFGKLEWSGGQVSKAQQSDTERFLEKTLRRQPLNSGPPVVRKNAPPPLKTVSELQSLLSSDGQFRISDTGSKDSTIARTVDKGPNGYSALKERTVSQGEFDEMQLQEAIPVVRVPEQIVKQQLQGERSALRPVVS